MYLLTMPSKKPKVMIYLDPDKLEFLKQWAESEHRSVNNLITMLLDYAIADKQGNEDKKQQQIVRLRNRLVLMAHHLHSNLSIKSMVNSRLIANYNDVTKQTLAQPKTTKNAKAIQPKQCGDFEPNGGAEKGYRSGGTIREEYF